MCSPLADKAQNNTVFVCKMHTLNAYYQYSEIDIENKSSILPPHSPKNSGKLPITIHG